MRTTVHTPLKILVLFALLLASISLACDMANFSFSFGDPTATPTPLQSTEPPRPPALATATSTAAPTTAPTKATVASATPAASGTGCAIPDVVGKSQKDAEAALTALGLIPVKQTEMSLTVPAGNITMQEPVAGVKVDPCKNFKVSIWVSSGAGASQATATGTTKATAAPTKTGGTTLTKPASFDMLYMNFFTDYSDGLSDPMWDYTLGTNTTSTAIDGLYNLKGTLEAYAAEASYKDAGVPTRIYLGGGKYGIGLKEFTVIFNRSKDGSTYSALVCSDQAVGASMTLVCDVVKGAGGKETKIANAHGELCSDKCDIELDLKDGKVGVYANNTLKISASDVLDEGSFGLRIDTNGKTFTLDSIAVYETPAASESFGYTKFREEFGDDWAVGSVSDDYGEFDRTLGGWSYYWTISAKKGMVSRANLSSVTLPVNFRVYADVQLVDGPSDVSYGIVYRFQDSSNYYYFSVSENEGTATVYVRENAKWIELVKNAKVKGLNPGDVNTISVEGRGDQYIFYVNDTEFARIKDTRFKGGVMGLAAELTDADQTTEMEFSGVGIEQLQP